MLDFKIIVEISEFQQMTWFENILEETFNNNSYRSIKEVVKIN